MNGTCRFCGKQGEGQIFSKWVRPTFTNFDALVSGDIICNDCLFWFQEQSTELAVKVGKEKRQRMRNYSHFVVGGVWTPLSKGNKQQMQDFLLNAPFPELAIIAESGQKHIAFRATRNAPGGEAGWVQFEEQKLFVRPQELKDLLHTIEILYTGFSKKEIKTAVYRQFLLRKVDLIYFFELESKISKLRGSLLFELALFLAQKKENLNERDERNDATGNRTLVRDLERDTKRIQKRVSAGGVEAIRERGEDGSEHNEQPAGIRQLSLFEI